MSEHDASLPIEDQTIENPVYDDHRRARNWVAIVESDKREPGGLRRTFLKKASGRRVHASEIQEGHWLEFAGDRLSASGNRYEDRAYCRVLSITNTKLVVSWCERHEVGKASASPPAPANPLWQYPTYQLRNELIAREAQKVEAAKHKQQLEALRGNHTLNLGEELFDDVLWVGHIDLENPGTGVDYKTGQVYFGEPSLGMSKEEGHKIVIPEVPPAGVRGEQHRWDMWALKCADRVREQM